MEIKSEKIDFFSFVNCALCFGRRNLKDMFEENESTSKYSTMIKNCFNIQIKKASDDLKICEVCIEKLNRALEFKRKMDCFNISKLPIVPSDESCEEVLIYSVIDTYKLIIEIEKRPAIYNKKLKDYSDLDIKERLWGEVCLNVIPNWMELSGTKKKYKGREVQMKWKSLKNCFARELAAQRKLTSRQGAKKKNRFIHFESLSFLLPFAEERETSSDISMNLKKADERFSGLSVNNTQNDRVLPVPRDKRNTTKMSSFENSLLDILRTKQEDLNEDKSFTRMLIPMLGELNYEQKHFAKIEILNIMRKAKYFQPRLNQPRPRPYHPPNKFAQTFSQSNVIN